MVLNIRAKAATTKEPKKDMTKKNKTLSQKLKNGNKETEEKSLPTSGNSPQELITNQLNKLFPNQNPKNKEGEYYIVVFNGKTVEHFFENTLHLNKEDAIDDTVWSIELGIFNLNNKRKTQVEVDQPKIFIPHSEIRQYVEKLISENKIEIKKVKKIIEYGNT